MMVAQVRFAEDAVGARMAREMAAGQRALAAGGDAAALVAVNAGGAQGPANLAPVQAASAKVWAKGARPGWLRAAVRITARDGAPWDARAGEPFDSNNSD